MSDIYIGKFDFNYWVENLYEKSPYDFYRDLGSIEHYDGNINVTLQFIKADFGFTKEYISHSIDYPIKNLPEELKLKLKLIQDEIKQHIEKEIEEKTK